MNDYPNAKDLFPSIELKSGICYFLWERDSEGSCLVTRIIGGTRIGPTERDLGEYDIFVRDSQALDILRKVLAQKEESVEPIVSGDTPFGLATNFSKTVSESSSDAIMLHAVKAGRRVELWVKQDDVPRGTKLIDTWKVLIPKAYGAGETIPHQILGQPIVATPPSCCTQTYLVVAPFESREMAESFTTYMRTRFFRFLVSLRKISQDAFKSTYTWVPIQTWNREWTDAELYEKYDISEAEQKYIAEMVKEMPA